MNDSNPPWYLQVSMEKKKPENEFGVFVLQIFKQKTGGEAQKKLGKLSSEVFSQVSSLDSIGRPHKKHER